MSYASSISKLFGRQPVWLYRFVIDGVAYHLTSKGGGYTSANNKPSTDFPTGQVWTQSAVVRGEIYHTSKANRTDTWFRLPIGNAVAQAVLNRGVSSVSTVEVWQGHIDDTDNEFQLEFTGRITEHEASLTLMTVICSTDLSDVRRASIAVVVQRPCRHSHYFTNADGTGCGLTLSDWQQSAECTIAAGRTLTVPLASAQPDGTYLAGILEYDSKEYMIQSHVGNLLYLESEPPGLATAVAAGTTNVLIAPGCNLTEESCDAFGNILNHGGFPEMLDTKFDGGSIV